MNVYEARKYLVEELKHLGALDWHNNKVSYYIKFKDCRIGSIRLSNHGSRKIYKYKFDYIKPNGKYLKNKLDEIIDDVHKRVLELDNFNPNEHRVYKDGKYVEIRKECYRSHILTGN